MVNHQPPDDSQTQRNPDANPAVNAASELGEAKLADMLKVAFTRAFPGFSYPIPIKDAVIKGLDSPTRRERRQREARIKELRNSPHHKQYLVS
jgi:hypothetical protein